MVRLSVHLGFFVQRLGIVVDGDEPRGGGGGGSWLCLWGWRSRGANGLWRIPVIFCVGGGFKCSGDFQSPRNGFFKHKVVWEDIEAVGIMTVLEDGSRSDSIGVATFAGRLGGSV
jgi:hypothetical protein